MSCEKIKKGSRREDEERDNKIFDNFNSDQKIVEYLTVPQKSSNIKEKNIKYESNFDTFYDEKSPSLIKGHFDNEEKGINCLTYVTRYYKECTNCDKKINLNDYEITASICNFCGEDLGGLVEREGDFMDWQEEYNNLLSQIKLENIPSDKIINEYDNQEVKMSQLRMIDKLENILGGPKNVRFESEDGEIISLYLDASHCNWDKKEEYYPLLKEFPHLKELQIKASSPLYKKISELNLESLKLSGVVVCSSPNDNIHKVNLLKRLKRLKRLEFSDSKLINLNFMKELDGLEYLRFNGYELKSKKEISDFLQQGLTIVGYNTPVYVEDAYVKYELEGWESVHDDPFGPRPDFQFEIEDNAITVMYLNGDASQYSLVFDECKNMHNLKEIFYRGDTPFQLERYFEYYVRGDDKKYLDSVKKVSCTESNNYKHWHADYSMLEIFRGVEELKLNGCKIKSLEFINNLPNLKKLYLRGSKVKRIKSFDKLKKLDVLDTRGLKTNHLSRLRLMRR